MENKENKSGEFTINLGRFNPMRFLKKLGSYRNDVILQLVFLGLLLWLSKGVEYVNATYNKSIGWYDWSYLFTEFYAFEKLVLHMTAIKVIMYFGFPTLDKFLETGFDSIFNKNVFGDTEKWKVIIALSVYFLLLFLSISLSNGVANGLKT